MAIENTLVDLRDEVYTRLLTKRLALDFVFNDFVAEETWRPMKTYEQMTAAPYDKGLVYVVGGRLGDRVKESRTNLVKAEYSVKLGFQKYIGESLAADPAPIDDLYLLVEQLEDMCRHDIQLDVNGAKTSYSRTEFLKDEDGVAFDFLRLAQVATFEAYMEVYFVVPLP